MPGRDLSGSNPSFSIDVEAWDEEWESFVESTRYAVCCALRMEQVPDGATLAVVLTSDDSIAEYHDRFMAISGPTDVLSWPHGPGEDDGALGDIMVSCETARRQAEELGHSWEREVQVLAVHGTLHLLGWDDLSEPERVRMQARVDEIVEAAGHSA